MGVFLDGDKVCLRPLTEADVNEEYLGWLHDQEVQRYIESTRLPMTLERLREYVRRFEGSDRQVSLAIVEKASNRHVGNVTLNNINWVNRTADTAIMIGGKDCWGHGYAFEAWSLLLEYAFQRLNLRKIIAGVAVDNAPSASALKRLGFQVEGTLRAEVWVEGAYRDALRLALFREDFHKWKAPRS